MNTWRTNRNQWGLLKLARLRVLSAEPKKPRGTEARRGHNSHRKQAIEKSAIFSEGLPQVFCGDVLVVIPFVFEPAPLFGKNFDQPFHCRVDQLVSLPDRSSRVVHKLGLDHLPFSSVLGRVIRSENGFLSGNF